MSYYNPHAHVGVPPPQGCSMVNAYAHKGGMDGHHYNQQGPPPPIGYPAHPYGSAPPQSYPPYAQPPPPPRNSSPSFARGW